MERMDMKNCRLLVADFSIADLTDKHAGF